LRAQADLDDYLVGEVYPALFRRLDQAFPEFGWVKNGEHADAWVATTWPAGFPYAVQDERPDRLMVYPDRPWWIKIHGHTGVRFLNLVNGGRSPHGQEFRDAVRKLCELAGKECPLKERALSEEEEEEARRKEARRAVLDDVNAFCQQELWGPVGAKALSYLREGRGLTEENIRDLGLGYYHSASKLKRHLLAQGHAPQDVYDSGAVRRRMERFITIPWPDEHGRLLTVYGRWEEQKPPLMKDVPAWHGKRQELFKAWERAREKALANGGDPKPWPEPQVPKTTALPGKNTKASPFCFDRVRRAGHKEVVLVEGVFDAAYLQVMGETRACASVAASLSGEQLKTLARCRVERVLICGDPDGGGDRGTLENADALTAAGIPAYVVPRLPEGEDPDEYIRRAGLDTWRAHVARFIHCFRHRAQVILKRHGERSPGDDGWGDGVVDEAIKFAASLPSERDDELTRHFWDEIAQATGARIDDLRRRLQAARAARPQEAAAKPHEQNGQAGAPATRRLATVSLDTVLLQPVRWLVPDLVPEGKLTLLAGDGGMCKSTITLDVAAGVTTGRPCCGLTYEAPPPADVLLFSCEDDTADTLVPRLLSAGADLKRCHAVRGVQGPDGKCLPFCLADVDALRAELVTRPEVRLVVIDPVSAFVGRAGVDDHKDSQLRALLSGLTEVAAETRVAIVLIAHLNKSQAVKAVARVLGSVGYVNAVRSALLAAPDPEDDSRRLLLPAKANLTPERQGLAYQPVPLSPEEQQQVLAGRVDHLSEEDRRRLAAQLYRIRWCGKVDARADEALSADARKERGPNKVGRCAEWLRHLLATYAYPSEEIRALAKKEGFTFDNVKEAKARLKADGLRSTSGRRFQGAWWCGFGHPDKWTLRPAGSVGSPSPPDSPHPHTPHFPHIGAQCGECGESGESGGEAPQTGPDPFRPIVPF
jgi:DNA primase/RecA-family ATPase